MDADLLESDEYVALNAMNMHAKKQLQNPQNPIHDTIPSRTYKELRHELDSDFQREYLIEYSIIFVIFGVFIGVILADMKMNDRECGIPIREWPLILGVIYLFWRTFGLF